eukprot:UN01766
MLNFCKVTKARKTWIYFLASLKNLKKLVFFALRKNRVKVALKLLTPPLEYLS